MTRINCIPVSELTREHLMGEYKELPRVFTLAKKAWLKGGKTIIPETYRLSTGHVTFFYNKLQYCWTRWLDLRTEMLKRGYEPSQELYESLITQAIDMQSQMNPWWNQWQPDDVAQHINRERIAERLAA